MSVFLVPKRRREQAVKFAGSIFPFPASLPPRRRHRRRPSLRRFLVSRHETPRRLSIIQHTSRKNACPKLDASLVVLAQGETDAVGCYRCSCHTVDHRPNESRRVAECLMHWRYDDTVLRYPARLFFVESVTRRYPAGASN